MVVQLNKIPNSLLYNVTMVKDIRQASFINRNQLKRGEPDVMVVSPLGLKNKISRRDLTKGYTLPSGKKVRVLYWKYNHKYIVVAKGNTKMYALRIPKNTKIKFVTNDKKDLGNGIYVLFPIGSNGEVVRNNPIRMSDAMFNRMFQINSKPSIEKQRIVGQDSNKTDGSNTETGSTNSYVKNNTDMMYKVVKRIIRASNGKIAGFVVSNGKITRNFSVSNVMDMCRRNKIQNITIVDRDGKEYLRGVGIRISNLPSISI